MRFQVSFTSVGFTIFFTAFFAANFSQAAEFRRGEDVEVSGSFSESLFVTAGQIRSNADASDDVFLAGGKITHSGQTTENLYMAGGALYLRAPSARSGVVAGGQVNIDQGRFRDLILAGGDVQLNATRIEDDFIGAAGQLEIGREVVINDSVVAAGGKILFSGQAGGDVEISGEDVTLAGVFGKNVKVRGQRVVVGSNAKIQGDFLHAAGELKIEPGAVIVGRNQAFTVPGSAGARPLARVWAFLFGLAFLSGGLLAPALVTAVFPGFVANASAFVRTSIWESAGKGLVCFVLAPLVLVALFVSVIGIPVGLFALPFLIVAALFAWSIAVFAVGRQIRLWIYQRKDPDLSLVPSRRRAVFGWALVGAFALMVALWIPVIGFLFCLFLFFAGVGALYMQMRGETPREPVPQKSRMRESLVAADAKG